MSRHALLSVLVVSLSFVTGCLDDSASPIAAPEDPTHGMRPVPGTAAIPARGHSFLMGDTSS